MPIKVTCPKCQGVLHAPDDAGGKRGKCPTCGTVLSIPAASESAESAPDRPFADAPFNPGRPAPAGPPAQAQTQAQDEGRRSSSFGMLPEPAKATGSRLLPPTFGSPPAAPAPVAPAQKPPADPFTKQSAKPPAAKPKRAGGETRAYARTRGGLWWVQAGYFLLLLGLLAYAAVPILAHFGVWLPDQTPGYLRQESLSSRSEIYAGVTLIPAALGLAALALGRFGTTNAPRSSGARGMFLLAALLTAVAFFGTLACAAATLGAAMHNVYPPKMLLPEETSGLVQRAGLAVALFGWPLAELCYAAALGKLGAGLQNTRLVARSTRYSLLVALAAFALLAAALLAFSYTTEARLAGGPMAPNNSDKALLTVTYSDDARQFVRIEVEPQLQKLGEYRPLLPYAELAVGGLLLWLVHTRLTGAARRAVRVWLDHHPAA